MLKWYYLQGIIKHQINMNTSDKGVQTLYTENYKTQVN